MRKFLIVSGALALSIAGLPMLAGCERELESERKVEVKDDGTRVTEEKKVTQDRETGEVTKTEEKTVDKPND